LFFIPLDSAGNPIFNPNSFAFGITFDTAGPVDLNVANFGPVQPVPEPVTIFLFGAGLIVTARRRKVRNQTPLAKTPEISNERLPD
jgi:hypothetical protein